MKQKQFSKVRFFIKNIKGFESKKPFKCQENPAGDLESAREMNKEMDYKQRVLRTNDHPVRQHGGAKLFIQAEQEQDIATDRSFLMSKLKEYKLLNLYYLTRVYQWLFKYHMF